MRDEGSRQSASPENRGSQAFAPPAATNKCLAQSSSPHGGMRIISEEPIQNGNRWQAIYSIKLACFHEILRPSSCSRARVRRLGLACRARLRVAAGVHIVLAKGRR